MTTAVSSVRHISAELGEFVAEEDINFGHFVTQGTGTTGLVKSTTGDNAIGVAVYDGVRRSVNLADKYVQYDPVRVAPPGSIVPVRLKKTAASGTAEVNPAGTHCKLTTVGQLLKETSGTRTATSVCKLLEDASYLSTEAAGTEKVVEAVVL